MDIRRRRFRRWLELRREEEQRALPTLGRGVALARVCVSQLGDRVRRCPGAVVVPYTHECRCRSRATRGALRVVTRHNQVRDSGSGRLFNVGLYSVAKFFKANV